MILLPIGHERQTVQRLPWVTFSLIGICVLAYFLTIAFSHADPEAFQQKLAEFFEFYTQHIYLELPPDMEQYLTPQHKQLLDTMKEGVDRSTLNADEVDEEQQQLDRMAQEIAAIRNADPLRKWGFVPNDPHFVNMITCLFLHEGFWHLFGNILFLFLAGCAIEDLWGRPLYLGFYLLGGMAATIAHYLKFSESAVPIIGASGAIAAIMGAFLVRLATTRIRFFYVFFFFTIKTGTFEAPAFIMLPLWFVQQMLYAALTDESAGTAFWAHVGGFVFGVVFGVAMNALRIEEKYIAPSIEKKVTLVQNPEFVQAIELSEKGNAPEALVLLQKVVRQDPNNVDAFLEMRHIYEASGDADGYTKACAGLIDAALRASDSEMVTGHAAHYKNSELQRPLPSKTMLGLAAFYEENADEHSAVRQYEDVLQHHPDDLLSMKAASKLARVWLEKLHDRERGVAAFWTAFQHPLANEEWRKALRLEMKRYQIDPASAPAEQETPSVPASAMSMYQSPGYEPPQGNSESSHAAGATTNQEEQRVIRSAPGQSVHPTPGSLPSPDFDGMYTDWTIVACNVGKPGLKGLALQNTKQATAMLSWKKIKYVSAARILSLSGGRPGARDSLLLDLVVAGPENATVLYRTTGKALDFQQMFPRVEQTFFDAYENFLGILLGNSGAHCIPDRERCLGPVFPEYADLAAYEQKLRLEIGKME